MVKVELKQDSPVPTAYIYIISYDRLISNLTELLQSLSAHDSSIFVRFEVLTTENMKGILSWNVTPYIRRRFG